MASDADGNGDFHVVFTGRVDRPTIFSSWSQAHPRVIGSRGNNRDDKKKFKTLKAAREAIRLRGFEDWDEDVRPKAEEKVKPTSKQKKYYAVVGCELTKIFDDWEKARIRTEGTTACFEGFRTEEEASDFIEDWKDAYADVWRREIRRGLDNGWRPRDMAFEIEAVLSPAQAQVLQDLEHLSIQ